MHGDVLHKGERIMALLIPKTNNDGTTTEYHRISNLHYTFNNTIIQIRSYVSAEYRGLEQSELDLFNSRDDLMSEMENILQSTNSLADATSAELDRYYYLSDLYGQYTNILSDGKRRYVSEMEFEARKYKLFTWADAYDYLKTLPEFQDATDC